MSPSIEFVCHSICLFNRLLLFCRFCCFRWKFQWDLMRYRSKCWVRSETIVLKSSTPPRILFTLIMTNELRLSEGNVWNSSWKATITTFIVDRQQCNLCLSPNGKNRMISTNIHTHTHTLARKLMLVLVADLDRLWRNPICTTMEDGEWVSEWVSDLLVRLTVDAFLSEKTNGLVPAFLVIVVASNYCHRCSDATPSKRNCLFPINLFHCIHTSFTNIQ